ncbi:MAG: DUF4350 domain-containing protein [Sandaracinaceae bacterium]
MLRSRIALGGVLLAALISPAAARAQLDFDPDSGAWNSVTRLVRYTQGREIATVIPDRLDVGTLTPNDSLLILEPRHGLPPAELTAFLRAGGRACLADDYGAGMSLLDVFRIGRGEPNREIAMRLRGNPELLVARPASNHRLTQRVDALVSNHPTVVYHQTLTPIFELAPGEALVLAGAVGDGRLVVLSDPSVLIDNMQELRGNQRFAENLVEYLTEGRTGTLYVLGPEARLVGRFGEPGADRPLHELTSALESLASLDLPPPALRIASLALLAIAGILAVGALPRRSPYRNERMFARPPSQGGFVGRVEFFGTKKVSLLQPLMVYKFELEEEILRRLGLRERTLLRDVLAVLTQRGMSETDISKVRELMLELDHLHSSMDKPAAPPTISAARFRELVSAGEAVLQSLEPARSAA